MNDARAPRLQDGCVMTVQRASVPIVTWQEIGTVVTSHGRNHQASADVSVSDEGKLSLAVTESLCGDLADGPELVFDIDKAERLYTLLGLALLAAKAPKPAAA